MEERLWDRMERLCCPDAVHVTLRLQLALPLSLVLISFVTLRPALVSLLYFSFLSLCEALPADHSLKAGLRLHP